MGRSLKILAVSFLVRRRRRVKITAPAAVVAMVAMRPLAFRKVNSKKLRVKGIRKAPSMMPIAEMRIPVLRKLRGLEIW